MKSFIIHCLLLFLLGTGSTFASGRLVAIADDWPLGTAYNSTNNGDVFTKSALNWLTEGTTNKNVLFDQFLYQNQWWTLTPLKSYLESAGYSVTVANVSTWNSQNLATYGAVIWASTSPTSQQTTLLNYINTGGNILYVGGFGPQPTADATTLLNAFNLQDVGVASDNRLYLTTYSSHPCVAGVQSLKIGGSTVLNLLPGFSGEVVGAQSGMNLIIAVPEPATICLFGLAGLLLGIRRK